MNSPPRSWQRFWWPKVDTPENAIRAAKNGGVAFGFIALACAIIAFADYFPIHPHVHGFDNRMRTPVIFVVGFLVIALGAARAAWRTYKKPSLLDCTRALICVLLNWAFLIGLQPNDVIGVGIYCTQILGTVAGLGGVRGAWAVRRFRQSGLEVIV